MLQGLLCIAVEYQIDNFLALDVKFLVELIDDQLTEKTAGSSKNKQR